MQHTVFAGWLPIRHGWVLQLFVVTTCAGWLAADIDDFTFLSGSLWLHPITVDVTLSMLSLGTFSMPQVSAYSMV